MAQYLPLPDGSYLKLQEGESPAAGLQRAQQKYPEAFASQAPAPKPEGGFIAAAKAGATELGGGLSALAGKLGLKDEAKAEAEYQAAKKRAAEIFKPTEEGWTEAPFTKFKELLGGSVPYMAAPLAAGAAAATLPVTGTAAALTTLGAAGLTSAGQFTATNLSRQLEEGKKLAETDLGAAALAAVPQAALDTLSMRMIPGIGRIFGQAGVKITAENAKEIAEQGLKKTLIDYTAKTGKTAGIEGVTEATQQVFERLQAGLSITDPQARQEYFDSFIGGAILGGTLAPVGRAVERGGEKRQARGLLEKQAQEERAAAAKAETERKKSPEYLLGLDTQYNDAVAKMRELQAAVPKKPGKGALPEEQMAYREAVDARNAHLKDVLQPLAAEYVPRKAEIAQLKEQQRVAGMTPLDYMLEQTKTAPIKGIAPGERARTTVEDDEIFPAIKPTAPTLAYAKQRIALANEQALADSAEPKEQADIYAQYLLQDPVIARQLVNTKPNIPNLTAKQNTSLYKKLSELLSTQEQQEAAALEKTRPDLYGPGETADTFAPWKQSIEAEERLREEEAMAVAPVRKEEAVISPEREEQIKALETARQRYRAAADTYLKAKGTPDGPRALQQLFAARKEYESFAPAPLVGQAPAPVLSPETEAQLDKALAEVAGEAPASAEELESRIQRLADTRKTAIAKVSENASELAQYEKLTQYMGTPQGLSEVARTPEMAEAAKRRMTPMLEQAQASRNEAIAAAIQEIRLQRDASGLVPLDKSDADLQNEFRAKLNADLQQAKGKAKVDEKKRQEAIAQQLQRINARIRQIEGGDRAGRLLGYASAFRSEPERVGELNNLYKAYRSLSTQQGLTPQAAQLNRTLQNLVDFYTVGGGAAKPRVVAKGPREARRELVLGERAFTGYEPTVEGTEVRYNKPRKMAEYKATPEEQALVEDMRARELAELNEAADQQYTPETSDRVKKQIFDALRQRIDNISAPATQEEVDAAKAQAAPQDQATGDLFAAATERAQAELQTAGERRAAARSEVGRAMAGMRGKSAIMDQAQRLAEKFGKDLGIAPEGTFAAAKTRLTQAQAAKRGAETEFKEKEQEALRAAADDALIAQRNAEATSRAANNTVDAIEARLAAEKETPAVEVRTPPRAMVLLQKIVELQALIGGRGAQVRTSQAPTKYSPAQFVFRRAAAEKTDADVGPVQDALNQAVSAAKQGEGWASDIEQVQAHMATLEKYLSRREAQGRLLPEAELMAKEWYRKLAAHEAALRRPMYGAGQLTPAEIRDYTQRRLELAQAEYDRIQLQIDGLHRQLLDTEVAVAKREVDRITGDINALVSRMERREGADLAGQELSALSAQYKDAVANLEAAQKTFAERKKAESVPFTRKSPGSALEQWMKGAQDRFDVSVQRFKDKQAALERQATAPAATPAITAAERRAEVEKQRSGLSIPELQAQLEGALKAQTKLKKRGSKKQREALAEKIAGLRAQIGRLKGESTFGTEYYAESEQAQAAQDAREEAEAREAGKEETTRAGRRKAAKEIFGVQRTIAETGEVPQATKDANKLDAVIKNNRQAFEMAVEQGFKSTAIRPQKRGKSATPERLMRTPLEGIAYRLRQEIVEKLAAPRTKKQNQELNRLREQLYGLEQAINTAPVTVEERRRTARAIWAKLPKDMRQDTVDKLGGRLPSGGISMSFFDRFADALETTVIRERLGQPISQAPVTTMTKAELAPIQAETEKRVAATMAATEELRTKYYEQKEKELSDKARLKGTIDEATQRQIEKEANEFADRVVQRIKEEEAREATQRMTEPMRGKPRAGEDIEFSRGKPAEGLTKEELIAELERALGQKGLLDTQNVLIVVESLAELKEGNVTTQVGARKMAPVSALRKRRVSLPPALRDNLDTIPDDAKGFVYDGKAYLIAENIGKDHALGVLLHEVGAHIGFRNFFNTAQYNALVETVKRWSNSKANTLEAKIGRAAKERVEAAKTPEEQVNDELLAYAVEEAFNAGVEPSGVKSGNAVQNWLRMIVDGFKRALEKFGLAPQKLKVGDLVNMAYGAANLELRGTWHGTGKPFKEFDFTYMGSGEGAQIFGWGTYRARAHSTAKFYQRQEAEKQLRQWQNDPKIKEWQESLTESIMFDGRKLSSERDRLEKLMRSSDPDTSRKAFASSYVFDLLAHRARENNFTSAPAEVARKIRDKGELIGMEDEERLAALQVIQNIVDGTLKVDMPFVDDSSFQDTFYYKNTAYIDSQEDVDLWAEMRTLLNEAIENAKNDTQEAVEKEFKRLHAEELASYDSLSGGSKYFTKLAKTLRAIDVDALVYHPIPKPPIPEPKGAFARVMSTRPDEEYYVLDLPLDKQSSTVQAAITNLLNSTDAVKDKAELRSVLNAKMAGDDRARDLADALSWIPAKQTQAPTSKAPAMKRRSDKAISYLLREYGIAGYKYLDGVSRDRPITRDSKFNYVDFYDKDEGPAIVAWDIDRVGPAEGILFSRNLPTASRVANQIIGKQPTVLDSIKKNLFGLSFRTQVIDALAPLEQIAYTSMDALKGAQMMYYLRKYGMRNNMTQEAIENGVAQVQEITRPDGQKERIIEAVQGANIKDIVKRLAAKDVIKEAGSADAANRLFTLYMSAIRGENKGFDKLNFGRAAALSELQKIERELASPRLEPQEKTQLNARKAYLEKNLDSMPTEADFRAAKAEIDANPTLKKAFDEAREMYNEYNTDLLNFLVQTGAISKDEAARLLRAKDYIPYYRMRGGNAELMIGGETPIRIGNLKDSPHLQELVGGEEPIFDFLTSSVQNTSMLLDMGLRNIAAKNVAYELADAGLASKPARAGKTGAPKGTLEFKLDGEDYFVRVDTDYIGVPSDLLVKGMAGIPTMLPQGLRLMGIPAQILRRAVTSTPVFAAKQLFRDSLGAYMLSGSDAPPLLSAVNQLRKASPLKARGVTGGQTFTGTTEDISRLLKEMQEGRPGWMKAFTKMEAMAHKADAATRQSQYESYRAQGLSDMEAELMSLESMNFSKRGLSPTMHMASMLVPFLNAQIQGLDVLYKAMTGNMPFNDKLDIQRKLFTRGASMFALTMAYAAAMQDDEEYKNAPPDVKYGNWFVRLPFLDEMAGEKVTLRVPIPFEVGYIFKALPEMLYNSMKSDRGAKEAFEALNHILIQIVPGGSSMVPIEIGGAKIPVPVPIPAAMKPVIEVGLGKSFFTGRDLESAREQQEVPGMRYRERTSEIAKYIGESVNFSPIRIEALVNGYTGGLGLLALQALSLPLPKADVVVPEKRWSELPLVGPMFQPADASNIIDGVYKDFQKVTQAKTTYDNLIVKGETGKAQAFLQENLQLIMMNQMAGEYRQMMGELTKNERIIRGSKLTEEEKRKLVDQIKAAKIQIAASVRAVLERKEPQAAPA
jgi:hypothetical protein